MDGDYFTSGGSQLTTSYVTPPSLDGTHLIYSVEAYGITNQDTLPLSGRSAEVVAPTAATSTAYTGGQSVNDATTNCEGGLPALSTS
jgi:hypothetical protein